MKPNVRQHSAFGDNHHAAIDAQVEVLEELLDHDGIFDKEDSGEWTERVREAAIQAYEWLNEENGQAAPSSEWKELVIKKSAVSRIPSGQLKTCDQARPAKKQHTSPCSDCPWARKSLKGWLGDTTVEEWIMAAQGESLIDCHTVSNQQCAGAAIFRSNICKDPRRQDTLRLPADKIKVFASSREFMNHHGESK